MILKWSNILSMLALTFALLAFAKAQADPNGQAAPPPSYPRPPIPAGPHRGPGGGPGGPGGPGPHTFTPPGGAAPPGPGRPTFRGGPPPPHTYFNTTLFTSTTAFTLGATATVTSAPVTSTASLWEQCGGKSYTGPSACILGAYCSSQDDWYAQCVTSAPIPGYQTLWGQCGGINHQGPSKCQLGFDCSTFNEYYAQCLLPTPHP